MQNLVEVRDQIKAVATSCTGTPTAKLIALLNAAGITASAEIAAILGVAIRTVQHARKASKSATHCANTQPIAAQPIALGATHCVSAQPIAPPARVEEKLLPPQQEEISQPHKPKAASAKPAASCKRGSRLPDDWVLPKSWGDWTMTNCPTSTPDLVRLEGERFADYWHAKAGRDAVKVDWLATWRNWSRTAFARGPVRNGARGAMPANVVPLRDPNVVRHAKPAPGSVMMELANA